ncbi:MAG TPA: hypothetical protein VFB25_11940 [Gaiellaceae bacterium]|nr:hypothetical protein [Gaiellaceae bacterium]
MAGKSDETGGSQPGGKKPPETRDALLSILAGFHGEGPPPTPPLIQDELPPPPNPEEVIDIEGTPEDAPPATPDDVVDIAGDSGKPPDTPVRLPSLEGANPFFDDDDDDDDDEPQDSQPWLSPWKIIAILVAAAAAVAISFFVFTSGTKSPQSAPAANVPTALRPPTTTTETAPAVTPAAACPAGTVAASLTIKLGPHTFTNECVGPAQYKSDPRNPYYSYFAWETMLDGRDVQIVITGGHLTGTVTSKVSPSTAAVSASGTKLADVDVYDNATNTKNFATTGSVRLSPSGNAWFDAVTLRFQGKELTLNGKLPAN